MPTDPSVLEQTHAAWSGARAAWWQFGASSIAAVATFSAVFGAFVLQNRQQRAEQDLRIKLKNNLLDSTIQGCRVAVGQVLIVKYQVETSKHNENVDPRWKQMVDFGTSMVKFFLDKDIEDTQVLMILLNSKSILDAVDNEIVLLSKNAALRPVSVLESCLLVQGPRADEVISQLDKLTKLRARGVAVAA